MCQRNIALNSHLTATGGEAQQVPSWEGGVPVLQVGRTPRTTTLGGGVLPASLDTPASGRSGRLGFASLQVLDGSVLASSLPTPTAPSCLSSFLPAGGRALPGLPSSCLTCPSIQSDLSKMQSELFLWLRTSWSGPGRLFLSPVLAAPLSSPASSEPRAPFTCPSLCPECPRPVSLTIRFLPRRRSKLP